MVYTTSLHHLPPKVGEIRVTCGRLGNYSSDLDAELRQSSKGGDVAIDLG